MSLELSQHKACEEQKLFIQVLGQEHPEGHRFVLYSLDNQEEQEWLSNKVERETLPEPLSQIYSWPWKQQPERNVWLEIDSEQGPPIRVPLFQHVRQTPWQEHPQQTAWQYHVVQPVVPLAFWKSLLDERTHAMPSRPGYIYVYYQGKIWREIEIAMSETGQYTFRDINLYRHRNSNGDYVDNLRPSVGKPLSEIWLPARQDLGWFSTEVKVAFSDVQWSAPRLNYLQANSEMLNQRFHSVTLRNPTDRIAQGELLAASHLVPQRERSLCLETQLVHPPLWTEDLEGSIVTARYQEAKKEQQQFDAGGPEAVNEAWNNANKSDSPLKWEVGFRTAAVDTLCQAHRDQSIVEDSDGSSDITHWEELPSGNDVLADARQREIPGLVLRDPIFELRHALHQTQLAQSYLSLLLERCASRPHYRSAILVQKRIMPERIADQENPLHHFADHQGLKYFGGEFHTCIATLARNIAHSLWEHHQNRLADYISHASYQYMLADYFSLDGGDYLSGFSLVEQCFTALSLDARRVDTLLDKDIPSLFRYSNAGKAQQVLLALLEDGSREPLHAMCFPDSIAHPAELPFQLPENETNDGSGRFRANALAEEGERSEPPRADELHTFEASVLAAMARTSTTGEFKRWANTLDSLFGKLAESGKNLLAQIADESQRTAMAARIYLPSFNASRSALHSLIGDLTFQPLGNVDLSRKVLLGVEDVASGLTFGLDKAEREYIANNNRRQFYGDVYRTSDGKLLGSTNKQRLRSIKEVSEAREVRFVFADIDSKAANLARRGRSRISWAERGAEAVKLPYILVVAEALNFDQSYSAMKRTKAIKEIFNFGAAATDLGLATLNLSNYITKRHQASRPVIYISDFSQKVVFRNQGTSILRKMLPELVSINWIVTKASGLLLAISMAWEAVGRFDEGDINAGVAYASAAVGATLLMVFSGPVGWIGLALLLGGGISGLWLTDGPMEQWLKHGPFGDQRDDAPWLMDPEEAYYRLQSLLANIQVSVRRVSPAERESLLARLGDTKSQPSEPANMLGRLWQAQPTLQQGINTLIEVRSALPGMGIELEDVVILSLVRGQQNMSPAGSIWQRRSATRVAPLLTQLAPNCITYFVHTPKNESVRGFGSWDAYRWDIQLQFRQIVRPPLLSRRVFPAPPPLEAMPSDMTDVLSLENAEDKYWIKETLDVG